MPPNLLRRVVFAVVAIPAALAAAYVGGFVLAGVVALVAALGTREVYDLATRQGIQPIRAFGWLTAAAFAPLTLLSLASSDLDRAVQRDWPFGAALWLVGLLLLVLWRRTPTERPLTAAAVTVFGALYAGGLPAFLIVIRHGSYGERSWAGAWLVFFPLVITWICDTAAMFGGRAFQGPRLWPRVSPGKTWSGSVCGVVAGVLSVPLLNLAVLDRLGIALPIAKGVLFALLLSIIGQVGDLAESLFKREAGVKDSSSLIPGHGGVLDRLDSLYFVLPTAAALYRWFGVI